MIDWSRVDELVDEIGAEDFGDVVDLFLSEVEGSIALLERAAGNAVVTEEQMHFLKGAALNLGFEELAQLAFKGEKSATSGRPDVVSPAQIRHAFEASRQVFLDDLPARLVA